MEIKGPIRNYVKVFVMVFLRHEMGRKLLDGGRNMAAPALPSSDIYIWESIFYQHARNLYRYKIYKVYTIIYKYIFNINLFILQYINIL